MLRQTGSKVCIFALAFTTLVVAKPPPPTGPWASYGKPVFTRALGPQVAAPGISTISVPYKPKSSPFFPKFVDPTMMISKKTDMLGNLFGGLGPVDGVAAGPAGFPKYAPGFAPVSPVLYADETTQPKQVDGVEEFVAKENKLKRGVVAKGSKVPAPKPNPFSPFSPFSPFAPKFSPFAPGFSPFAPSFSPFAPNFAPGFGSGDSGFPYGGFGPKFGPGMYDSDAISSRRRRSIVGIGGEGTKALGPPPAYPGLTPIAEEPETLEAKLLKLYDPATAPKETLPGMFGPFGPFSPYAGAPIDPMTFTPITPKPTFLETLLKNLATPAPVADDLPVTEIPVPKSTIVPPGFWAPSSIIPGPGEYTSKVATFLDKLFSTVILNKTATAAAGPGKTVLARSLIEDPSQGKVLVSRSIEDIKSIAAAKDSIVDTIFEELGELKTDMISTLNDFIIFEKTAPLATGSKKPMKPISPFAAFFAPPTPDPTLPFKQRMAVLSQVFDMLTGLQKNISLAVQDAIKSSTDAPIQDVKVVEEEEATVKPAVEDPNFAAVAAFNKTLVDAIKTRLAILDATVGAGFNKPVGASFYSAPAKRNVEDDDYLIPDYYENHRENNRDQYKRAVQMQMHQGYQSMPPGTVESVQAGGGTVPGHQGGGIKLLNEQNKEDDWGKWAEWAEYYKNQNEGRKHHHNHH